MSSLAAQLPVIKLKDFRKYGNGATGLSAPKHLHVRRITRKSAHVQGEKTGFQMNPQRLPFHCSPVKCRRHGAPSTNASAEEPIARKPAPEFPAS
jgi:hypothetical protein